MQYKRSPIFYMGNKFKLLDWLIPLFPNKCGTFVDLFGGSGCVSMNYQGQNKTIYNEFNNNVVELIKMVVNNKPEDLDAYWKDKIQKYNLPTSSVKLDEREGQIGVKSRIPYFNALRDDYNKSSNKDYRDLYLLACYSINHLIRFNTDNQFNVSSGSDSYNEKNYEQIQDLHNTFKNVIISNNDALKLKLDDLPQDTFIYCDPPYLNTEAVYNEKRAFGGWDINKDYELFKLLEEADKKGLKWGLSNVYENRGLCNEHLHSWVKSHNYNVKRLERNYNPFSRGNSNNYEVYICNYDNERISTRQISMFFDKYLDT